MQRDFALQKGRHAKLDIILTDRNKRISEKMVPKAKVITKQKKERKGKIEKPLMEPNFVRR